ncbi:hypothetical protein CHS0354_023938 [Potamilus streckersoni]|uniref:DUF262 domain-containing protein n=1 Tax=Potamilus streckersoni TaxID=2493646 RepID=A0AAE0RZN4_9BIVA|nr:hypothetical protein CHS0354_023938 [Potamilus streckersoni]
MKANQTKIEKFLATNETTFAIPVYQRNYDWTLIQCKQLLHDILEAGNNNETKAHFIGSIVYVHDDVYTASGLTELTIIDGQQRLTTITLIYIALYRLAKQLDNQMSKITRDNFEIVQRGLSKLIFVDISLDRQNDNPQRIFESLNSTGLELSQADLIRNYILMGLSRNNQEEIYRNFWEVIEKNAKDESLNKTRVSEFIRDYLTLRNKEIPNKGDVYVTFKKKYPTTTVDELKKILSELKSLSLFYNKLVNPQNEDDKDIRQQIEYINRLEINVAFPFLMKVYEDYSNSLIDKPTLISVLSLVQSFTFRRFILGLPNNALNKIFMNLYDKVEQESYLLSIQKSLMQRSGVHRFPRNTETVNAFKEKDVYNMKPKNRTYLLERIENYQNTEPVIIDGADITIEHIFPQNPDPKWKIELGAEEYNFIKENYLNTIGNLTLSGNNGKLGNKPFAEKQVMNIEGKEQGYQFSRLWLNRDLKEKTKWGKQEIEDRANKIADRVLKIWEIPDIKLEEQSIRDEKSIFDAEPPTNYRKLNYATFLGERLEVKDVTKLYVEVFKRLFQLQPELFLGTPLGEKMGISKTQENLRAPEPLVENYFIEKNIGSNQYKFDRIKEALTQLDLEEELMIKYAD